ncbi:MAG: 6-phosphogluconolactonase [Planctomycetota bacterium]
MTDRPHQPSGTNPAVVPYALEPEAPPAPALPGKVVRRESMEQLIDSIAADLVIHAHNCVREFGDFHLALSGGSTPQPLYERLMYDPNYRRLPWRRTHLWIVDERCVPFDDDASNFRAINETIGDHADIPQEQVHPIFAMSDTADVEYEQQLKETLSWREKGQDRLDYVLLGMGTDGHTASLFPHTDALDEEQQLVRRVEAIGITPAQRVTMTYPLINAARYVAVLVSGSAKADMIRQIASGEGSQAEYPIKGIHPHSGVLHWYLDADACRAWDDRGAASS